MHYGLMILVTRLAQSHLSICFNGAGERNRTSDLLITNQLLYRLSYTGFL